MGSGEYCRFNFERSANGGFRRRFAFLACFVLSWSLTSTTCAACLSELRRLHRAKGSLNETVSYEEMHEATVFPIGDKIYRTILDRYRECNDAPDVFSDAIDWWELELQAIERALTESR